MTTTDQDRTIQRIAEEYDRVTVRQNAGPNNDRAVVVCPDGRAVVLDGDGEIIADSHKKTFAIIETTTTEIKASSAAEAEVEGIFAVQALPEICEEMQARYDAPGGILPDEADAAKAISRLDPERFLAAWRRAYDWEASSGDSSAVGPVSAAEAPMLSALWAVQVQLERLGIPLDGQVPGVLYERWYG